MVLRFLLLVSHTFNPDSAIEKHNSPQSTDSHFFVAPFHFSPKGKLFGVIQSINIQMRNLGLMNWGESGEDQGLENG